MKATGIVRRIDDLGRVVIPKEIRRTLRIREGDPLEIFTDNNGEVIFKKYSPIGELATFAADYVQVINRVCELPVVVCDRDHVVAVAGIPQKELLERRISHGLDDHMDQRKSFARRNDSHLVPVEGSERQALCMTPILAGGDVGGAIFFLVSDHQNIPSESDIKLIQVAAAFLGKQLEE